ncbi:COX15/CtaA family protein [Kistimonas scapharcae]|uniref:COX15/CtaA family protein n=1 Tax=Kistimonas scapharcae TaxID=1036133 RepID=A0ABP8V689_9GAMM
MTVAPQQRRLFILSLVATCLSVVVVGLGAWTRLVHAGLGCPDWPGCYGFLSVPNEAHEIATAQARFPDDPVDIFKGWAEMIHRYVAGTLLLLVGAIALFSWRARKLVSERLLPLKLPLFILGLIICQALFGMWTVTLKLWPQVVTAHLLGGFATLSLLLLLTLRLSPLSVKTLSGPPVTTLKRLGGVALLVVIIQIFLGGWTSSNYAALACPDFPTCHGVWLPELDFAEGFDLAQSIGPNYLGGQMDSAARTAIHFVHRIGAVATTVIVLLMIAAAFLWLRRNPRNDKSLPFLTALVTIALGVQVALGVSNILFYLPLPVAVAHNLGGAFLLTTIIAFNYRLSAVNRNTVV